MAQKFEMSAEIKRLFDEMKDTQHECLEAINNYAEAREKLKTAVRKEFPGQRASVLVGDIEITLTD